jgi:hypothetical protein
MSRLARWILVFCVLALALPLPAFIGWMMWRDHALLAFCRDAHAGMSLVELTELERSHWIDETFLVQAMFSDYVDQAHTDSLEFRSQFFDPDFACAIAHDGTIVKDVTLLTLEGFIP